MSDQVEIIIADDKKAIDVFTTQGPMESDVTLQVEDTKITVSKDYLSTCSPVFYNMFYGDYDERRSGNYMSSMNNAKCPNIQIGETSADDFIKFLSVISPSRCPITRENVAPVLALADRFLMESLKKDCIAYISTVSDQCSADFLPTMELLRYAFMYNSDELKKCLENRLLSQEDINTLRRADEFKDMPNDARDFLFDLMFRLPVQSSVRSSRPRVFFQMTVGGAAIGRIVMELFTDAVPRTAENFRALCTGEKGMGKNEKLLHYKASEIHLIVKDSRIVGGDILDNGGLGESIYGEPIEDENFRDRVTRPGLLTVGRNGILTTTSCSLFCIFTKKCPADDGKRVAIGCVVEGMDVVKRIEQEPVMGTNNKPSVKVLTAACGQI